MHPHGRLSNVLITIWIVAGAAIYFHQFIGPGLLYLSRLVRWH